MKETDPVSAELMAALFAIVGLVVAVIYSIDWSTLI
jgi:hypothetical protein